MAGTGWGCNRKTLRVTYDVYIKSAAEYAIATWWPMLNEEDKLRLEIQQRHCARQITGCMLSTRKGVLMAEAGMQPMHLRAAEAQVKARERYARLPEGCPAREAMGMWELHDEAL